MRAVTASFIGFCFMIPSAWAVEVSAPVAPATQPATTPVAAAHTSTCSGASAQQAGIIPAVATTAQTVQPTEKKPLTAEEIAKQKAQQDAKVKALVKDQATRLQQLEKPIWKPCHKIRNCSSRTTISGFRYRSCKVNVVPRCFYGAATLAVGVLLGFLIASYVYTKRRRQW